MIESLYLSLSYACLDHFLQIHLCQSFLPETVDASTNFQHNFGSHNIPYGLSSGVILTCICLVVLLVLNYIAY